MSSEAKYEQDEVVWAKIRGWADPWWPGVIARIIIVRDEQGLDRQKALVNFIGDNTHSTLPLTHVAKYKEKYDEVLSKVRDRKLKESIQIADQIFQKNTSYQVEVNKLAQKKMMQKMVAKSRAVIAQNEDDEEISEEEQSSSNKPANKRQSKRQKPKRQYLRSNAQRDSSSESLKLSQQQSFQKKLKVDEIKQEHQLNLDLEFQNLLSQLSLSKPDYQIVVYKLRKVDIIKIKYQILNEIKHQNPSTENIIEILKNNRGKILNTIYKILHSKSDQFLEDYRSLLIRQLLEELKQCIDMLKTETLKLYFDSLEIFQYLELVTKSTGEKKIIKLFDKLQHQKDEFIIDEEEVPKSFERSQSESWESQNPKQSFPLYSQEQSGFQQKRLLRSKIPQKQVEIPQQKKPKKEIKQPRPKTATQRVDSQKKSETKVNNQFIRAEIQPPPAEQKELPINLSVANTSLRKKVCFKILGLLQNSYKLDRPKAQEIVLKLEARARKSDQIMGKQYTNIIKGLISRLKNDQISVTLLLEYNQQKEDSTKDASLWDKILSGGSKEHVDLESTQGLKNLGLGSVSQEDHQTDMQIDEKNI